MTKGFTIVELIVVIVIIGILTTLVSVVTLRGQLIARDKERENDVKIIATFLENTYRSGQADGVMVPTGDASLTTATAMGYPSTALISSPNDSQSKAILGALDPNALKSPVKKAMSLVAASNNAGISGSTAGGITIDASSANDVYVYQPFESTLIFLCRFATGNAITGAGGNSMQAVIAPRLKDNCVFFLIYYFSESSNSIKSVPSINLNKNSL